MEDLSAGGVSPDDRESNRGLIRLLVVAVAAVVAVLLLWLLWPRFATVPNLIGLDQTRAQNELAVAGFQVGLIATRTIDTTTAGNVVGQLPPPGMRIAAGSAVDFTIAQPSISQVPTGVEVGTSAETSGVMVPELVGQTEADARSNLQVSLLGAATRFASSAMPIGEVIAQSPVAGTPVAPGTVVTLTLSSGTPSFGSASVGFSGPILPDALGQTLPSARSIISNAGYGTRIVYAPSVSMPRGRVFYQKPAPGPTTSNPSTIELWVSTGVPTGGWPYPVPNEER